MHEIDLRRKIVNTAKTWSGKRESDGSFKVIIDTYNSQNPLPRRYKLKYTDSWCAGFVTAVGIKANLQDIILPECSCPKMIELYKSKGLWVEDDDYVPKIGDIIMYDWQDSGVGDNRGVPDHVGIVVDVASKTLTIIEGNIREAVGYRTVPINGRYIRGYCTPDYKHKSGNTKEKEDNPMYERLQDVPKDYRPTIEKIMKKKVLVGYKNPNPNTLSDNVINVSEDFCRTMTVLDRLGLLGR